MLVGSSRYVVATLAAAAVLGLALPQGAAALPDLVPEIRDIQVRVADVKEPTHFQRGDTVLLPARMNKPVIKTLKDCVWLEVTFPTKPEIG